MIEPRVEERLDRMEAQLDRSLERVDSDLAILERHSAEVAAMEKDIQDAMHRWDREYKDSRLHSVPRPRKHMR